MQIDKGLTWIKSKQNSDFSFGAQNNCIYETAFAYLALATIDPLFINIQNGFEYLIANQQINGSWKNNPFETAITLLTIQTIKDKTIDTAFFIDERSILGSGMPFGNNRLNILDSNDIFHIRSLRKHHPRVQRFHTLAFRQYQ